MTFKIHTESMSFFYDDFRAITNISIGFHERQITAIIGPSGCGKSTFLRTLNRINDTIPGTCIEGKVLLDGEDIYSPEQDVVELRRRVGMVFQRPNPFPKSVYDNVAFGPEVLGLAKGAELDDLVQRSLEDVALWDEVKDSLRKSALSLSDGQQQRLCLARVLAVGSEVILMDEPCSALDPIATLGIEELMRQLAEKYTIIIVRSPSEALVWHMMPVLSAPKGRDLILGQMTPKQGCEPHTPAVSESAGFRL